MSSVASPSPCLRHEYCTELARRSIDIRIAQKLMGHSDIKLTANNNTKLNSDDIANIANLLAEKGTTVKVEKVEKRVEEIV